MHTCENCKNFKNCWGFAAEFGNCEFEPIRIPDWEKMELTREDGIMENPRVVFSMV